MPRSEYQPKVLIHSSKRIKDSLTEKRNWYNLDLSRSSLHLMQLTETSKPQQDLHFLREMELSHMPDSGREVQFPPRATQWKERESLNRKSSQVSAKQPRELEDRKSVV